MAQPKSATRVPSSPWWLGSKEGITDHVYPPFVPLSAQGSTVLPWGRTYRFAAGPLPTAVRSAKAELLARPIQLRAKVDGEEQVWRGSPARILTRSGAKVTLESGARSQKLRVTGKMAVEFDGMIRVDLQIAGQTGAKVDDLTLEVPIPARYARYLYHFPGAWGSAYNAGALPTLPWTSPFKPFVWLGDEDRGFCWFSESDRNVYVKNEKRVLEIAQDGDSVVLKVHLLEDHALAAPLDYTFGFEATPIRPNTKDAWDYKIAHTGNYGMEKPTPESVASGKPHSALDEQADLGVKTICFHEHWTDIQNYTRTTHVDQLRSLVAACHAKGIQLLLYHGYEMSNIAPEFAEYSEKCLVAPRAGGYTRQPKQTAYIVCYRSAWQDFMAAGIARLIDEYGIDGVYLDGTANPWACANELHGCGYRRPDGTLRPTYSIFAAREMMRRIFNIVKSRKPDGQVNLHQSTCMTIPSVGFATSYWDGEQFGSIDRGPRFDQVLPLAAFRCEFMGRQWGVPSEFLCYNRPYTISEAYAFTLQHDVLVRGGLESIETHLWRAMDQFGRKTAEWLPYWRNSGYVTATGDQVLAGLYLHRGRDAIIVVSNLGPKAADSAVALNLARSGLGGRSLTATDVVTGEKLATEEGKLTLHLPSMGWRMLWLR